MATRRLSRQAQGAEDMARRAGFKGAEVEGELTDPTLPEGMEQVEGTTGGFFNFDSAGQLIKGTLMGTTPREVEREQINATTGKKEKVTAIEHRWQFLIDGQSDVVILPNHFDLTDRLSKLAMNYRMPVRNVAIRYRGTQQIRPRPGRASFLHRYAVGYVKAEQVQLTPGREAEETEKVPF